MSRCWVLLLLCVSVPVPLAVADERPTEAARPAAPEPATGKLSEADYQFFERKIRPLLSNRCFDCHSQRAKTVHGGLKLDSAAAVRKGGDSGPAVVAGKPQESLLVEAVEYDGDVQMPPKGKLPAGEIALLNEWVRRGAPMPVGAANSGQPQRGIDWEAGRRFWSFQPVRRHPLPAVSKTAWPRQRVDWFVLAAMERANLKPAPPADRATLVRRLYFDLIGLPPTARQVREFAEDDSPTAYRDLVERLLASPQYGEKWARLWLDMARYTDKTASWLYKTGQAHLYRDWVVRSFNEDLPYDEFVHRQLATDLIPDTGPDDLPALGFISLSPTYWKELKLPCEIIKVIVADEWEERVDAVSRTFLGLTVACARCHDHKFDPVSSADYYALAGVFASCRQVERPVIPADQYEPVRKAREQVTKWEAELAKLRKAKPTPQDKLQQLQAQIQQRIAETPQYHTPLANALSEESLYVVRAGKTAQNGTRLDYRPGPRDLPLFVRGNPNRPGPIVRRRFLTVLSKASQPTPFRHGSGRLELARSITTDAAPLAARVLVNRIWLAHFGQGLVATPSNFGKQGSRPTHPELLDDLAARFISGGWSIKQLHREILLSATWRQSSQVEPPGASADPSNRWLSRMNRRRLDFESWRDAMLVAGGGLDNSMGGMSSELDAVANRRRTLYGTVHRRDMSTTLQIHDFPDPTQHSPQRSSTITPLQGLYALNGPLLAAQSAALVARLDREVPGDAVGRVERLYEWLYSRPPNSRERKLGLDFVAGPGDDQDATVRWTQYAHVLLASNEFLFVD